MNPYFRKSVLPLILAALAGCATQGKPPPAISLDEPVQAQPLPEAPKPVEVVTVPEVLPMPAQMKPVPDAKPAAEPADETVRVARANAEARIAPTREATSMRFRCGPSPTARCISLRGRGPRDRDRAPAGRGAGDGRCGRHGALDCRGHIERQW